MRRVLVDTNILVYVADSNHYLHRDSKQALADFLNQDYELCLTFTTVFEYCAALHRQFRGVLPTNTNFRHELLGLKGLYT
jgi:hypothetical protein